jgi:hypothetical protein
MVHKLWSVDWSKNVKQDRDITSLANFNQQIRDINHCSSSTNKTKLQLRINARKTYSLVRPTKHSTGKM